MMVPGQRKRVHYGPPSETGSALEQKETQVSQVLTKKRLPSGQQGRPGGNGHRTPCDVTRYREAAGRSGAMPPTWQAVAAPGRIPVPRRGDMLSTE